MNKPDGKPGDARIAELMEVLEVSRQLAAASELQPLLERVEQAALKVLGCERATVFLLDRKSQELYSRVSTGVKEIRFSISRGIAGEVARTGKVVNVADAYADQRFNPEIDRQTGFTTRNMLTFPLVGYDNSTVGVLQVLNKRGGGFNAWDETLVQTFGAQAGVAVQRQLLLEQFAEKQRIERDLKIARSIQQALLPEQMPQIEGFDIAGWSEPADDTGGDCFDFLALEGGRLAVTLADATGHGIGPALVIAECRALLRSAVSLTQDLGRVVALVNNLLSDDLPDDRFVTAFFGVLEPAEGWITCLSAGHGPILFYEARTKTTRELPANGVPLGIFPDAPYEAAEVVQFARGDTLVLLTDGFVEWADPTGALFGTERVCELVRRHAERPAAEIISTIHRSVLEFARGTAQADDLTAVVLKRV